MINPNHNSWKSLLVITVCLASQLLGYLQTGLAQSQRESESYSSPLSDERRQQYRDSFEYIWERIRDSYWDPELGGVDWQSAYDELKPELDAAKTRNDAIGILDALVSRMQVSHFSIIPAFAYESLAESGGESDRDGVTGIDARIVEDDVVVVDVTPGSPADEHGIRPGWIVESVGEIVLAEKLAEARKELADNPHQRTILASAANSRLRGKIEDEIRLTLRDGNDRKVTATLALVPDRGRKVRFGHLPEFRVWVESTTLKNDIGYFRFNAFMDPIQVMGAYNQFIRDHRDSPGIIIDVRGNGGGNGDIAVGMIGWLMPGEKESMGKVILRNDELNMIVRPRPRPFHGPVAVLIDEMSASAAEFFASGIKDLTHARLFGTTTAGAVLGSQIEKLPTGDGFQFAAANFISQRTGKTLEGVGVTPHEVVELDRQSLLDGKDPPLEAAIEWIRAQSK